MPHRKIGTIAVALLAAGLLTSCSRQETAGSASSSQVDTKTAGSSAQPEPTAEAAEPGADAAAMDHDAMAHDDMASHAHDGAAHQDHDSKHGGTFFMALDNLHHIEGALERPGVFRVYVYDAYTKPVNREELGKVDARVIWGEQDGAPEITLRPNADSTVLEAKAPATVHFPVTLTLLCRFPGAPPTSRPELFTFPFSHFSHIDLTPHTHPGDPPAAP